MSARSDLCKLHALQDDTRKLLRINSAISKAIDVLHDIDETQHDPNVQDLNLAELNDLVIAYKGRLLCFETESNQIKKELEQILRIIQLRTN